MLYINRRTSLWLAVGVILAGALGTLAIAQGGAPAQQEQDPPYRSSIQAPVGADERDSDSDFDSDSDSDSETAEAGETEEQEQEENDRSEAAESAQLSALAKISPEQARAAALARIPGTPLDVELDNENGNVVYSVEVRKADRNVVDIKVDAGTGQVLHIETDEND